MDVESIFSIGIICSFFGAVASQLPLTKIRNFSYLYPTGALLFLFVGCCLSFGPAFTGGTIPVSSAYNFVFSYDTGSGLFTATALLMTFALSFFTGGMQ